MVPEPSSEKQSFLWVIHLISNARALKIEARQRKRLGIDRIKETACVGVWSMGKEEEEMVSGVVGGGGAFGRGVGGSHAISWVLGFQESLETAGWQEQLKLAVLVVAG